MCRILILYECAVVFVMCGQPDHAIATSVTMKHAIGEQLFDYQFRTQCGFVAKAQPKAGFSSKIERFR